MKKFIYFIFLLITCISWSQNKELASSSNKEKIIFEILSEGHCSGNAYCSACSSCNYCKNCNSGGSCGVCTTYATPEPIYEPDNEDIRTSGDNNEESYNSEDNKYDEIDGSSTDTLREILDTMPRIDLENNVSQPIINKQIDNTPYYLDNDHEKSTPNTFWIIVIIIAVLWFLTKLK